MLQWIRVPRLTTGFLAALLAVAAYRLSGSEIRWIAVVAMTSLSSSAMLMNDWRDRYHDARKGKLLTTRHPKTFLVLLSGSWALSGALIIFELVRDDIATALLLAAVGGASLVYSETRKIPVLPSLIVAAASSSPALLPIAAGKELAHVLPLFVCTFLVVFGREVLKDMEDACIDGGYKWTIPSQAGFDSSMVVAVASIVAGMTVVWSIAPYAYLGASVASMQLVVLARVDYRKPKVPRRWLDAGTAIIMLSLIAT